MNKVAKQVFLMFLQFMKVREEGGGGGGVPIQEGHLFDIMA